MSNIPGLPEPRRRRPLSPAHRALIAIASVVLLGAVIFVSGSLSGDLRTPSTAEKPIEGASVTLYRDAVAALESGDTTKAIEGFEAVLEADPNHVGARQALDSLRSESDSEGEASGEKPEPDTDDAQVRPDDPGFSAEQNPSKLLPTALAGYYLDEPVGMEDTFTRSGGPKLAGGDVSAVVWTVNKLESKEAAERFIERSTKVAYDEEQEQIVVDGTRAFFGTDGSLFATVGYVRGRYAFEVTLTSTGRPPKELKSQAITAARAFPDKP